MSANDQAAGEPLLVGAPEAARLSGISEPTWWRLHSAARVPAPVKLGGRTLWRSEELRRWVAVGCPMTAWERLLTVGASPEVVAASADRIDEVDRVAGPPCQRRPEPSSAELLRWLGCDRPTEKQVAPSAERTKELVRRYLQEHPDELRQLVRDVLADDLPEVLADQLPEAIDYHLRRGNQ